MSLLSKSSLMALAFGAAAASAAAATDDPNAGKPAGDAPKPDEPKPEAGAEQPGVAPAAETPPPPPPPPPPAAAPASSAGSTDTVLASVAAQAIVEAKAEGETIGFAAAQERCKAVLESDEGKANPSTAMFLLFHSEAKAGDIISHLKANPGAKAGTGAARTVAQPRIDLTGGNGASTAAGEGDRSGEGDGIDRADVWGQVQKTGKYAVNGAGVGAQGGGPVVIVQPAGAGQ